MGLKLSLGEALQITAGDPDHPDQPGVTISYDSSKTGEQALVDFGTTSLTASSPQFGVSGTILGLVIYNDGFKFTSVTLAADNVHLGGILAADHIALTLSNGPFIVTYSSGAMPSDISNGSSLTAPVLSLSITNLRLFPDGGFITTTVGSLNAFYDFTGFDGSSPSGVLRLAINNLTIRLGDSVQISVPTLTITPDLPTLASIPTATVSFPLFNGLGLASLTNFQLLSTGFSVGSLNLTSPAGVTINLGGVLSLGSVSVSVTNFAFNYELNGLPGVTVSGSINVSATNLVLFPSLKFLSASVGSLNGTFAFDSVKGSVLDLQLSDLNISLAGVVTIHARGGRHHTRTDGRRRLQPRPESGHRGRVHPGRAVQRLDFRIKINEDRAGLRDRVTDGATRRLQRQSLHQF